MNFAKPKKGLFNWKKKEEEEQISDISSPKEEEITIINPEEDFIKEPNLHTNPKLALDYFKEMNKLKEEIKQLKNTTLRQKIDQFLKDRGFEDENLSLLIQEFMER